MKRVTLGFVILCVASISAHAAGQRQLQSPSRGVREAVALVAGDSLDAAIVLSSTGRARGELDLALNRSVVPSGVGGGDGRFRIEVDGLQWCCDEGDFRCCLCPTPGCPM